jgi:hypothetical protein
MRVISGIGSSGFAALLDSLVLGYSFVSESNPVQRAKAETILCRFSAEPEGLLDWERVVVSSGATHQANVEGLHLFRWCYGEVSFDGERRTSWRPSTTTARARRSNPSSTGGPRVPAL